MSLCASRSRSPALSIFGSILPGGSCQVLSPRKGMVILSNTSENAQFSGSKLAFEECVSYLDEHHVCSDDNLYKYISVAGVSSQTGVYSVGATGQYDADGQTVLYLSTDVSFPSAIIGVFPDGSLLLAKNRWSSAAKAETKVLYGKSSSFPVAGEPRLLSQNIPAGCFNQYLQARGNDFNY